MQIVSDEQVAEAVAAFLEIREHDATCERCSRGCHEWRLEKLRLLSHVSGLLQSEADHRAVESDMALRLLTRQEARRYAPEQVPTSALREAVARMLARVARAGAEVG